MRCLSLLALGFLAIAAEAAPPTLVQVSPNYDGGLGGKTIVIQAAESFTGVSADYLVTFGNTPGTVVGIDGAALSVVAPPNAAPTQTTITVQDLRDAIAAEVPTPFYYVTGPPSVLRVLDPAAPSEQIPTGSTHGGHTVVVQGTGLSFTQTVRFGGIAVNPATIEILSDTEVRVVTPASTAGLKSVSVQVAPGNLETFTSSLYRYVRAPEPQQIFPAVGASAGGTETTVFGQALNDALSVTFGGVPATITLNTEGRIEVTVGPHPAGVVDVIVTNAVDSTTLTNAFTFFDPPVIASINPAQGPATGGNDVTFGGTNLGRLLEVRFGGVKATLKSSTNTQLVVTAPPHAAGAVTVEVSTVGGVDTTEYTYVAQPVISAVDPDQGSTRGGYSVFIFGEALDDPAAVYFGTTEALVLESSATEIEVMAPPRDAPGAVPVSVITVGGTAFINGAFTYVRGIGVDSVSPDRGFTTGGETLTILGTGFGGLQGVSVGGTPALVSSIDGVTRIVIITPPGIEGTADILVRTIAEDFTAPDAYTYVAPDILVGAVRGTIRDAVSQALITRAVVVARIEGTVVGAGAADANGEYLIPSLEPGDVNLEVFAPGYQRDIANAVIIAGEEESIQFALAPLGPGGGTVAGRVEDFTSGIPLVGARVQAIHNTGIVTSYTCADGSYDLPGIPLGDSLNVTVAASAPGYSSSERSVMIGSTNVTFALNRGLYPGLLGGSVFDNRNNNPIKDAQIILTPVLGLVGYGRKSGDTGAFSFKQLDYATYDMRVSAVGFAPHTQRVTLSTMGGQQIVVKLVLPGSGGTGCAAGPGAAAPMAGDIVLMTIIIVLMHVATARFRRPSRAR